MHDGNYDENLNDSHHALLFCQASFRDWVQASFKEDSAFQNKQNLVYTLK